MVRTTNELIKFQNQYLFKYTNTTGDTKTLTSTKEQFNNKAEKYIGTALIFDCLP
jgi:hypothetical protein